jgi:hypothetical protein
MDSVYQYFPVLLAQLDQAVSLGTDYLSGAAGPLGLVGYLPPIVLAVLSRQRLHALVALMLCLATFAVLRLDEPALAILAYAGSYLIAAHAFWSRDRRRQTDAIAERLGQIDVEMSAFLAGLDRRSRDADRAAEISPLPQPVSAENPEAANSH